MSISDKMIRLAVRGSADDCARYKILVDSDWNKSTFDQVLELMRGVISIPRVRQGVPHEWLVFFSRQDQGALQNGIADQIFEHLTFLASVFREPRIPKLPPSLVTGRNKAAAQTMETIRFLLLQGFVDVTGNAGFFQDLQSLLYLNAVHYLLPHLQKANLSNEHDSLINAMHIHALVVWRREPAHMFYLLGTVMGHLGNKRARLDYLDRSQAATPIDDHSFLTKASSYWAELVDVGEADEALDYLLRISRISPPSYLGEIEEMIRETVASRSRAHA